MSIREAMVPWSFAAHRTKAKMLPGEYDTSPAVNDALLRNLAKPDPAFDAILLPIEFNFRETVHPGCFLVFEKMRMSDHLAREPGDVDVAAQLGRNINCAERGELFCFHGVTSWSSELGLRPRASGQEARYAAIENEARIEIERENPRLSKCWHNSTGAPLPVDIR